MGNVSIKRVVADAIASYLSSNISGLTGKVSAVADGPQTNAGCLALKVLPDQMSFEPAQADEVYSANPDDGKVIVDVGSFTGLYTLQLFASSPSERELYEQQIMDLFLKTVWAPGTIYVTTPNLTINGYASLYSAEIKVRLDSEDWSEELAFEQKRSSFVEVYIDFPALTTFDAANLTSLQIALSDLDSTVVTDIAEIQDDGSLASVGSQRTMVVAIGQSNANVIGISSGLTGSNVALASPYAAVPYIFKCDGNSNPPVYTEYAAQSLQPVFFSSATRMGWQLSLMRELDWATPNQFVCLQYALSATSLFSNWNATGTYPTGDPDNLANAMCKYVRSKMVEQNCSKVIFVWQQGENDAGGSGTANSYASNLTALVALIRTYFPAAPFVVIRLNSDYINSGTGPFTSTVQAQEALFVSGDSNSSLINIDSITPDTDHTHYTADGYVTLGYLYSPIVAHMLGFKLRPHASFTESINTLSVTFTDTSIDRDGTISAWLWDFGDGNTSTSQNPSHTYASGGAYNVQLTVIDSNGQVDTIVNAVTVTASSWTVDAINTTKAIPQSTTEWTSFLASLGLATGNPSSIYLLQDLSGNPADVGSANLPLIASGTGLSYRNAISGWATKAINFTDNGSGTLATTSASQTDLSTADELIFMWIATTLAGLRTVVSLGTPALNKVDYQVTALPRSTINNQNGTFTGTANPISSNVYGVVLHSSATLSSQVLYLPTEKISATYIAGAGKRFGIGAFARNSPQMSALYAVRFTGSAARLTSTQIKTLMTGMGVSGIPWS
jgi:PKD repeat protein